MDKILKWCGFTDISSSVLDGCYVALFDNRVCHISLDMNFFFKYVVPKLAELGHYGQIGGMDDDCEYLCTILLNVVGSHVKEEDIKCYANSPNQAWQEALLKLVGE